MITVEDIFDTGDDLTRARPLAARMRPRNLNEFVGQTHILGEGSVLRQAIAEDRIGSLLFYGPPGVGKTTLAEVIAASTAADFIKLSAISAGKGDISRVVTAAKDKLRYYHKKTILFIDEIHRFNKGQQDALLPAVEEGIVTFIGATTENPFFEVNKALLSRASLYVLQPLSDEEIKDILIRALVDEERGLGALQLEFDDEVLNDLALLAGGDARVALNGLEAAAATVKPDAAGKRRLDAALIEESLQRKRTRYDKNGDTHYDVISAFIKSMRGSDPDAAVYWLARMIDGGENMEFVARRIIICAAEDVGMADPQALAVAVAAFEALRTVGLPEARIPLAEAAIYVALAPKSNAVLMAIDGAMQDVKRDRGKVPYHLRDASHSGVKSIGHGVGYKYPHDYPHGLVKQDYLPEEARNRRYYRPSAQGREAKIAEWLAKMADWKKE